MGALWGGVGAPCGAQESWGLLLEVAGQLGQWFCMSPENSVLLTPVLEVDLPLVLNKIR